MNPRINQVNEKEKDLLRCFHGTSDTEKRESKFDRSVNGSCLKIDDEPIPIIQGSLSNPATRRVLSKSNANLKSSALYPKIKIQG